MLKLFDRNWLAIVMLLTVAALPMRTHASTPSVVISEIAWAGSSSSASDEWIELANVSDDVVDLSGWTLAGASSTGADLKLPGGSIVQPHSTYVISNYESAHANTALAVESDFVTASLSLPNTGFHLRLFDDAGALVDVAGGTGAPFAGRSGGTADADDGRYASMVRTTGLGDGALAQSWADADTSSGFKAGVEDYGTPGAVVFAAAVAESEVVEEEPAESVMEEVAVVESVEETPESTLATIHISEFVVDPNEGESEWIELVNAGDEPTDLTGWTLEDATGKQTALEGMLAPGEYLFVTAPLGKLNNDTDSIFLKDAVGVLINSVEYGTDDLPAPKDGAALARGQTEAFDLTYATTPGGVNVINREKPDQDIVILSDSEEPPSAESESLGDPSVDEELLQDDRGMKIRISEFVVDPDGDGVEWIELFNAGDTSMTLGGWTIEDASGQASDLSAITIQADSYAVIESPKGKLNNDGDSIILKDASGTMVESVTYGGEGYPVPKDGEALARNGGTFEITELTTPGSPNLIFVALEEIVEVEDNSPTNVIPPAHQSLGDGGSEVDSGAEGSQVSETTEEAVVPKTLRFVELYPNTNGSDEEEEYVVIENTGSEAIDVSGWSIQDASTKRFAFKDAAILAAGATIAVGRPQTKLTLNNGGDTLELIAPDGEVVDRVTYTTSAKGATYDFVEGSWRWSEAVTVVESIAAGSMVTDAESTTTPVATEVTHSTNSTNATSTSTTMSSRVAQSVTIAQAKAKADGQSVIVKGVVTSAPGTFGSQIFYLQDETDGVQAYLYHGDFPELAVGDVVQVSGELSTSRGERRIKLSSAAHVVPTSGVSWSEAITLTIDELDGSLVGALVKTEGLIRSIDTNKLALEQAGATLTVYLKSNPLIDAQQFERGDDIEVTGVLTSYDGELRLRPRTVSDVTVVEEALVASAVTTESSAGSSAGMILLLTTMAALVALALWRYLPRRRLTPAAV